MQAQILYIHFHEMYVQYRLLGRTLIPQIALLKIAYAQKKGGGNQMGRKKDDVILLRCYKKEKEELREKAKQANMNMSEYIIALSEKK